MNFNLNLIKPIELIKKNFKSILKFSIFVLLGFFAFISLVCINIISYKQVSSYSLPILASLLLVVCFVIASIYLSGFYYEIIHNFIKEKEDFMPIARGRFGELLKNGFKGIIVQVILACIIAVPVYFISFSLITFLIATPIKLYTVFSSFYLCLMAIIFFISLLYAAFITAFANELKIDDVFKVDNFKILGYALPEFIYSLASPVFLTFIMQVCFFVIMVPIVLLSMVFIFLYLTVNNAFVASFVAVILFIIFALVAFIAFLLSVLMIIYYISLVAQSFNYGKYFLCMGQAPKREKIEWIVPIALILIVVFSQVGMLIFQNKMASYIEEYSNRAVPFSQFDRNLK